MNYVGMGYNFATDQLASRVVDNQNFKGTCRKTFDGNRNQLYRMPYNVDDMQFDLETSDDFSATFYDSLKEYTEETIKEQKMSFGVNFGVKFDGVGIEGGLDTPRGNVYKQIHQSSESQDSKIVKISSEVVTSKFLLKGDNLLLDDYFEDSIRRLPRKYDSKSYFDMFRIYGTHYIQAGALGGRYEYYYVYSDSVYKEQSKNVASFQDCIKANVRASIFYVHAGANYYQCNSGGDDSDTATKITNQALHKVVNIEGKAWTETLSTLSIPHQTPFSHNLCITSNRGI